MPRWKTVLPITLVLILTLQSASFAVAAGQQPDLPGIVSDKKAAVIVGVAVAAIALVLILKRPKDKVQLHCSSKRVKFGDVEVGQSKTLEFVCRNINSEPVRIDRLAVTGDGFTLEADSVTPMVLSPDGVVATDLIFQPAKRGGYDGRLTIEATGLGKLPERRFSFRVEGKGVH